MYSLFHMKTQVMTMEYTTQLNSAVNELQRITGIRLEVAADSAQEEERALKQIRCLCNAYKEKFNKNHFLKSLMTGSVSPIESMEDALRLHIAPDERRILFLLEMKGPLSDAVKEILRNLFPSQTKAYLIPMAECSVAILRPVKASESEQEIARLAHMIVDTLNAEALTQVWVAYSRVIGHLAELAEAWQETSLALRVGRLFYSEQTVFPYNRLGIGRLIYRLPVPVCESFLKELFGEDIPDSVDEETTATINRFLQNNLNIAETSRQLHMHRNTLIYRLDQVEKRTGLDLRRFEDAMTFKIASLVMNYLQTERNSKHE